ncbi:hypothetical protein B0H12DRAFT_135453 [Mycena haematopus]|nr:hypothetical protein B0H12DRAFT_135453 [Mycena haematopus]
MDEIAFCHSSLPRHRLNGATPSASFTTLSVAESPFRAGAFDCVLETIDHVDPPPTTSLLKRLRNQFRPPPNNAVNVLKTVFRYGLPHPSETSAFNQFHLKSIIHCPDYMPFSNVIRGGYGMSYQHGHPIEIYPMNQGNMKVETPLSPPLLIPQGDAPVSVQMTSSASPRISYPPPWILTIPLDLSLLITPRIPTLPQRSVALHTSPRLPLLHHIISPYSRGG